MKKGHINQTSDHRDGHRGGEDLDSSFASSERHFIVAGETESKRRRKL